MIFNRKNFGFSLMEIMIVVAIIGLLVSISMPNISKVVSRGKISATKAEMNAIKLAIRAFKQDIGFYPITDSDLKVEALRDLIMVPDENMYPDANLSLWRGPYMDTEFLKEGDKKEGFATDAWGKFYDYIYYEDDSGYVDEDYGIYLKSSGPNGKFESDSVPKSESDDILVIIVPPIK